jgi:hypothetical protein
MSFGGGGGSTTGVNAHVHNNASGEGGTLKKETIVTLNGNIIPIEAFL